jgi:YD repeat-containing protein
MSCKKEENPHKDNLLTAIRFYNDPKTFDVTYTLHYNAEKKLERVSCKGNTAGGAVNYHYFLQYTSGQLDSIIQFDSITNTIWDKVGAQWDGGKMSFFWRSNYTYDTQGRMVQAISLSGSVTRWEYFADSSVTYFDPSGAEPEYKLYVTYRADNVKNPFRLKGNEALYPINSYVFNFVNNTLVDGMYGLSEARSILYRPDGTVVRTQNTTHEGSQDGYPLKLAYSFEGTTETRFMEFTY